MGKQPLANQLPGLAKFVVNGESQLMGEVEVQIKTLFSDRPYVDTVGPQELEGLTLIQIPRHSKYRFRIDSKKPLTVYRLVSDSNDNWLLDGYQKTDLKVNVVGRSIHREVVKRSFPSGIIDLYAGGLIK